MTVERTEAIDAIGIDKITDKVVLKIIDPLDWQKEQEHLLLLQKKINSYLRFLESGEVYKAYKHAKEKQFVINIGFAFPPTSDAIKFLDTSAHIIADAGFALEYAVDSVK